MEGRRFGIFLGAFSSDTGARQRECSSQLQVSLRTRGRQPRKYPKPICLIDGQELASLMFDRDVGVITEQTYAS